MTHVYQFLTRWSSSTWNWGSWLWDTITVGTVAIFISNISDGLWFAILVNVGVRSFDSLYWWFVSSYWWFQVSLWFDWQTIAGVETVEKVNYVIIKASFSTIFIKQMVLLACFGMELQGYTRNILKIRRISLKFW